MKVLFVASEAAPLVKVGGLGDVVGSLPRALNGLGHDVRVIIPRYGDLAGVSLSTVTEHMAAPVAARTEVFALRLTVPENGVPVYLVESGTYFGGRTVYYGADLERFLFFSRAVADIVPRLDWQPQLVHCHDWHAALTVMWLKKLKLPYASMFTIHNLAYQGPFDEYFLNYARLREYWDDYPRDAPGPPLCFMSQGILWADLVSTVSETYAKEILTPEYGMGLDPMLRYREQDLIGIRNGIDYEVFDPETDPWLPARYNALTMHRRRINKLALQKRAGFPEDSGTPLIGMVQRLDRQKGFDIFGRAADRILTETPVQIVILGSGTEQYERMLRDIAARYPGRVALFTGFDEPTARLIYGGCDMFLMPSYFEPCGLGQMIAMRYGAIPIVRHTGGLVDTVPPLSANLGEGNGFVFQDYSPESLVRAIKQALDAFGNKTAWEQAMRRVMKLDFSWRASAARYEAAYRRALSKSSLGGKDEG